MSAYFCVFVIIIGIIGAGSAVQHSGDPKSVLAQVGTAARFNCTAMNDEPVYWTTKPYESPVIHDIYIGEKFLLNGYGTAERFFVEVDNTLKRYDLVIENIKQSDAGVYICIHKRGLGKKYQAELVVWDNLSCHEFQPHDSYMGENVFGLDQDALSFTCRMSYSGNIRPHFKWSAGEKKLTGTHGMDYGTTSSSLILAATSKFDGSNITCEALIRASSSEHIHTGIIWTSRTLQVKYAMLRKEIVEKCPGVENALHCNPPCSYKLEAVNGTQRCAVRYATGADVKLVNFYQSSRLSSKTGEWDSIIIGLLIGVSAFLFSALVISVWCWVAQLGK